MPHPSDSGARRDDLLRVLDAKHRGHWVDAIRLAKALIGTHPDCFDAHILLAWMRNAQGNYPESLKILSNALALAPGNPGAAQMRFSIAMEAWDPEAARECLPHLPPDLRVEKELEIGECERRLARNRLSAADENLLNEPQGQELETLRRLYESYPGVPEVVRRYASSLAVQPTRSHAERDRKALFLFRRHFEMEPTPETTHWIVWLSFRLKDFETSIQATDRLLQANARNATGLLLRGVAREFLEKYEEAIADYRAVLEVGGYRRGPHANLLAIFLRLDRNQEAEIERGVLRKNGELSTLRAFGESEVPSRRNPFTFFRHKSARNASRARKLLLKNPAFQAVPCRLCGALDFQGEALCSESGWPIMRCAVCGLLQINPQPGQELLKTKYQGDYYGDAELSVIEDRDPEDVFADRRLLLYRMDFDWLEECGLVEFETSRYRPRLLEVGCGAGALLMDFTKRGWDCEGTEIAEPAIRGLRRAGFTIHEGFLEQVNLPGNSYDLVVLHHVIEHLLDPLMELKRIHDLLRPGGWLFVVTPGADSVPSALAGERWFYDSDHTFFFSRKTLLRMLEESGLEIVADSSFVGAGVETWDGVWLEEGFGPSFAKRITETNQGDVLMVLARKRE